MNERTSVIRADGSGGVQQIQSDFKEFLKLVNEYKVDSLLVGGYAVGYYGYPRATAVGKKYEMV